MLQGRQFEPTLSHLTSRFPVDPDHHHDHDCDDIADADDHDEYDADADADDVYEDFYPSPWPQTGLGSTHAPPKIIKITTFEFSTNTIIYNLYIPPKFIKVTTFFLLHNTTIYNKFLL